MLQGPEKKPRRIGNRDLDIGLLDDVIRLIEKWLQKHQREISPDKKARVIRLAYEHCVEKGTIDSPQLIQWAIWRPKSDHDRPSPR
jgi:hypothetical protein